MLQQTSKEFKTFFLLKFTEELIKQTETSEIFELKKAIKKRAEKEKNKKEKNKEKIKKIIKHKEKLTELEKSFPIPEKKPIFRPLQKPAVTKKALSRMLRIPEPKLPLRFKYLKPTPSDKQIDLEKLKDLIKDPAVKIIECNGPDENIIVQGMMGRKKTNIILNKEEINRTIKKFSETAKIPFQEGIFRVAVGKLILLAIISEVIGSKFLIRKMAYNPIFR